MAFVFTLLYISISLLSPDVLPEALQQIHILEIIVFFIVITSVPNLQKSGIVLLKDTYFVTGLICAAFLSVLMTGWIGGAFAVATGLVTTAATYFFVAINCTTLKRLRILSAVLLLVTAFILVQGMLAAQSGVLTSPYFMRERELVRYRGMGMIADPNDLAQVLVAVIGLLWLRWKKGAYAANICLTLLPAAFLSYGVFLTHSRGGLLALIAMTLYGFKDRLGLVRSAILTGLLAVALVGFNASGGRNINDDDGDRIGLWSTALSTFRTHPITGVGVNHFGDYSGNGLTAHNSYVLCLAEMGLFGYICWMGAIVTSWSGLAAISLPETKPGEETAELPRTTRLPMRPPAPLPLRVDVPRPGPTMRVDASEQRPLQRPVPAGQELQTPEEELAEASSASHVVRAALVGVLVAAFFISRTYATILYVVFGISAALQMIHQRASGDKMPHVPLFKRISLVTLCSVLFIYLFVRFRGPH